MIGISKATFARTEMLYREKQESPAPLFHAVGCICLRKGKVLLLLRQHNRSHPNSWGLPSGKVDLGETEIQAVIREVYEETSILRSSENLRLLETFHVVSTDVSFLYSLYICEVPEETDVRISQTEHQQFQWFEPDDALRLRLVPDLEECLRFALPQFKADFGQYDLFTKLPTAPHEGYVELEKRLPWFGPRANTRAPDSHQYWVSFGPPGAGKSTTLREMLKKNSNLVLVQDQTILNRTTSNLNIYLNKAWKENLRAYFFHFQMEVLPFRFWYTFNAPRFSVVDETIYSTLAYSRALHALRWINNSEYQTFYSNYSSYVQLLPKPEALLYFHCSTETLVRRIAKRGRILETFYPLEYVEALASAFEEVATELSDRVSVTRIDTGTAPASDLAAKYGPSERN